VRYQAGGQFGSGFKAPPKSDAGIREVPLAPLVIESIRRQLPADRYPDLLVFTGPGGDGILVGTRTMLSRYNFRRIYQRALSHAQAMTLLTSIRTVPTICATPSRPGWKTPTFPLG
jgi:integrase